LHQLHGRIFHQICAEENVRALDPFTLLTIASIIFRVIEALWQWWHAHQTAANLDLRIDVSP